jgi:hypothetical protein
VSIGVLAAGCFPASVMLCITSLIAWGPTSVGPRDAALKTQKTVLVCAPRSLWTIHCSAGVHARAHASSSKGGTFVVFDAKHSQNQSFLMYWRPSTTEVRYICCLQNTHVL